MNILKKGLSEVPGFKFSATACGIRYPNRKDMTLLYAEQECIAAGVFTLNKVHAAPVKLCRTRINNKIKAILINSTNANACTGDEGLLDAQKITAALADNLQVSAEQILMSSTGIIGHRLPVEKMVNSLPLLQKNLASEKGSDLSEAIMTTDTVKKESAVEIKTSLGNFIIAGTAKGAGMIAPNMGTLLCYTITNAPISQTNLQKIFKDCVDLSLNALTIDGDTSTNDSAIILSPDLPEKINKKEDLESFKEGLLYVLKDLSEQLVIDGEGVTKCAKIIVKEANSQEDANKACRSIAESLLVKTALFGKDPNWGRIACAAGYSGANFQQENLSIKFNDEEVLKNGLPCSYSEERLVSILENQKYQITIKLGAGDFSKEMLTSDISYEYVKINAEYTT